MAALAMPEARPESEPAKAMMQTNKGAGLGTPTRLRSTMMAIIAAAVVSAGPEIARQSKCMRLFPFAPRLRRADDGWLRRRRVFRFDP